MKIIEVLQFAMHCLLHGTVLGFKFRSFYLFIFGMHYVRSHMPDWYPLFRKICKCKSMITFSYSVSKNN